MAKLVSEGASNVTLPMIDPPYQKNYEWEKFDYLYWRQWMEQRRWLCVAFVVGYMVLIQGGSKLMKNRTPFKLRRVLFWWNLGLAIFSTTAFTRTLPEVMNILSSPDGFHQTVCSRENMTMSLVFYEWLGTWSKVVELGDTAFVILRKQPLLFLHWYHHMSVLIYAWTTFYSNDPIHRWYLIMNAGVHAIMYTYYAFRTLGLKIPRFISLCITSLQILQMGVGCSLNLYSVYARRIGIGCSRPNSNIAFALLMYFSYLVLFLHFFYIVYIRPQPKVKAKTK